MSSGQSRIGMKLYVEMGEAVLQDLFLAGVDKSRAMILVGHSFEGLVIKQVCLQDLKVQDLAVTSRGIMEANFLQSIKLILFYSTPHVGSPFSDMVEEFKLDGDVVKYSKIFNVEQSLLHQDFQYLHSKNPKWHISGVGESRMTESRRCQSWLEGGLQNCSKPVGKFGGYVAGYRRGR